MPPWNCGTSTKHHLLRQKKSQVHPHHCFDWVKKSLGRVACAKNTKLTSTAWNHFHQSNAFFASLATVHCYWLECALNATMLDIISSPFINLPASCAKIQIKGTFLHLRSCSLLKETFGPFKSTNPSLQPPWTAHKNNAKWTGKALQQVSSIGLVVVTDLRLQHKHLQPLNL